MNDGINSMRTPVGIIKWPFYKYDVLMPEQIKADLFAWLYLSIFLMKNEENNEKILSYREDVKLEVKALIREMFSSVIDDDTLNKIINYVEQDFVIKDETMCSFYFKEEILTYVKSFEELFSQEIQVKQVFQDCLTGDVLPYFNDLSYLYENTKTEAKEINSQTMKKPSTHQIKKALKTFTRLLTTVDDQSDQIDFSDNDDPDAEIDWIIDDGDFSEKSKLIGRADEASSGDFNVIFLSDSRTLYKLDVEIFIEDGKFFVSTPFNHKITYHWLNKRFSLALSSGRCSDLSEYINNLKDEFIPREKEIEPFTYRKNIADQMIEVSEIYRMITTVDNDDLKSLLIDIDYFYTSKSTDFFNRLGKFLECLINPIVLESKRIVKTNWDFEAYRREITQLCNIFKLNEIPMINRNIYDPWVKGWIHFKADLANIIITNKKIKNCSYLYPDLIRELYELYDLRNSASHYNKEPKPKFDSNDLKKLARVTRVMIELY